jgi:hypothetical protein
MWATSFQQETTMSVTEPQATRAPAEAVAGLLAMLLAGAQRSPAELVDRLAALDAFARLGLDARHFRIRLDEALQGASELHDRSWLADGDRARIERLMAPLTDPAVRKRICAIACAVLGEDDTVSHSRCHVLDHVVSAWHIELPHHPQPAA